MQRAVAGGLGLAALTLLGGELFAVSRDLETPRDLHGAGFAGSSACTGCHPSHAASFERTYHRTMTREADRQSVRAPFAGEVLSYGGYEARMTTEPDADGAPRFVVTLSRDGEVVDRATVSRTVGSHRDQQLLAREDDRWVRLPVAWDLEEGRWMHMNEAFLTPDPPGFDDGAVALADYARHVVAWNDNCVFCHNVGPRPGLDPATGRFETTVAELGVACEACHGPGAEHARENRDPFRRYALHGGGTADREDPTIVNPRRLSPARASEVCGRCHGQRITDDVGAFLRDGDPFVPGDELSRYSTPLFVDTALRGRAGVFAPRFWDDGTARLTAYEHQGYLQSACASAGQLGCNDCHAMHDGDPRGQIRPSARGDAMCTRCHDAIGREPRRETHARNEVGEARGAHASTACVDCHMPRVVYGLRDAHRSHRIDSPRPAARSDRPDACALCHLDRPRSDGAPATDLLFAGDPIQRAVIAAALGRVPEGPGDVGGTRDARAALLLEAMRDDRYPGVRSVARASLRRLVPSLADLERYAPTAPLEARRRDVLSLAAALDLTLPSPDERASLRARASERAIEIGE